MVSVAALVLPCERLAGAGLTEEVVLHHAHLARHHIGSCRLQRLIHFVVSELDVDRTVVLRVVAIVRLLRYVTRCVSRVGEENASAVVLQGVLLDALLVRWLLASVRHGLRRVVVGAAVRRLTAAMARHEGRAQRTRDTLHGIGRVRHHEPLPQRRIFTGLLNIVERSTEDGMSSLFAQVAQEVDLVRLLRLARYLGRQRGDRRYRLFLSL